MSEQCIKGLIRVMIMAPFAAPFIIPPISTHSHTLILLHDRGSSGQEFGLDILNATDSSGKLLQTRCPGTKFIFPNANHQCVTSMEGGPRMPQWFDNFSTLDPSKREALQLRGLREGSHHIHEIIDAEPIPLENIFLGGFSQGGAMALYALLAYRPDGREGHLGGFVGMSVWLPLRSSLDGLVSYYTGENQEDREAFDINTQVSTLLRNQIGLPPVSSSPPEYGEIPILFVHGKTDNELPVDLAKQATESLRGLGLNATLKEYEGLGHAWRSGDEIDDIAAFLTAQGAT